MHSTIQTPRGAFTMLELIMVTVILGIVSSIGAELIANVYKGYVLQRAQYYGSSKTELVALQIANRLANAVPNTVVRRLTLTGATEELTDTMTLDPTGNSYTVLQWVGADMDSVNIQNNTTNKVGWSGVVDVDAAATTSTSLVSPGSDFAITNQVQINLGRTGNFAVYFPYDLTAHYATGTGETITLTSAATRIFEHYKIAWTSYALVVENNDLFLYYGFNPEMGAAIGNKRSLLMEDISTFKFQGSGRTVRFKICKEENIGGDVNITSCKEKAVF